jgi:glycosyltransferase involved in cell wall biosynthesis
LTNRIRLEDISLVVPVKDNQTGVDRLLNSFFDTHTSAAYPGEIIIIDNNSAVPLTISESFMNRGVAIRLEHCQKPGPASARNVGASYAGGQWLLFVDSDCIPTETMISGYLQATDEAIGYQGYVGALGKDTMSRYYESQQIHQPPAASDGSPAYLVTANALVSKVAFDQIGGFCEDFVLAGGEDIDLALRLKKSGQLAFVKGSVIQHQFEDGLADFLKRMIRYGRGNRMVRHFHNIKMFPLPSTARDKSVVANHFLVLLQWLALLYGYVLQSLEMLFSTRKTLPKIDL